MELNKPDNCLTWLDLAWLRPTKNNVDAQINCKNSLHEITIAAVQVALTAANLMPQMAKTKMGACNALAVKGNGND